MLGNRELVLDTFCEVYDLLKPWRDFEFFEFVNHTPEPGAIYLIGRRQFTDNVEKIKEYTDQCLIILSNPHEGSLTLKHLCQQLGIEQLVKEHKILLIGGGKMESDFPCLTYDSFLPKILDYQENIEAISCYDYKKTERPYKFLFLNGRHRPHRRTLIHALDLSQALWTNLDEKNGPIKYLPCEYEVEKYQSNLSKQQGFVKYNLFNNEWGEIYLNHRAYQDTHFSLVTETVFDYPYSFRTEKIWKPIAIGHPWIAVANYGYYRDLQNLGFKTFDGIIDESFDLIEDNQQRIDRIVQVVNDLCCQDLSAFLRECEDVCKYNQQHLAYMRNQIRQEFPTRFQKFTNQYVN